VHSLAVFLRLQGRPVILAGEGAAAEAKRRLLQRAGANVVSEASDARLAIVAVDEPDEIVGRLKMRGILVNAVDRPDLCDFTLPAMVDRDPVLIAIGTGGASAGLAKALRQRLERLLPASLGDLASAMQRARADLRKRWPNPDDRRHAIDAALDEGGQLDPFSGRTDVASWLVDATAPSPNRLVMIQLASPDADDLTLRQARLLGQADLVYHRPDVPSAILDRARADAQRIACDRTPDNPGSGLALDLSMGNA
jgi:uroporphyrin-III C-methyltransferase/precorrin-2 dehydrogenase/sirohydrochlorin ferrochelatase